MFMDGSSLVYNKCFFGEDSQSITNECGSYKMEIIHFNAASVDCGRDAAPSKSWAIC